MKFIIVGYGAVAATLLPMLFDELGDKISSLTIIDPLSTNDNSQSTVFPATFVRTRLTPANYKHILINLDANTFLLNLSVDVSSLDLVVYCQERGAKYLDTCIEPWAGHYSNHNIDFKYRTNYHLREGMLALKQKFKGEFTILLSIAFDEITSTRAYKQDFELFDSLGPSCLSTWIRNAAKDEAAHYGNAIKILKLRHQPRLKEAPAVLESILTHETSQTFTYNNTFIFDHDTDDFSHDLLRHSKTTIIETLERHQ